MTEYISRIEFAAFFLFPMIAGLTWATPTAACGDVKLASIKRPFEFVLSKADEVDPTDVVLMRRGAAVTLSSRVAPDTPIETRGTKLSQRSEIRETRKSSEVTRDGDWICYEFAFFVTDDTTVPNSGETRAKLSLAQFHQETGKSGSAARPALLFELTPDRELELVFGAELGGETVLLVSRDEDLVGRWWRIEIAARWSRGEKGRLKVWVGPMEGKQDLRFSGKGQNTTTGHVYQKLGAYRSFLERDPELMNEPSEILYQDISRNGEPARIRRK